MEDRMAVQAYVNFQGECRAAVRFYADVFGVPEQKVMTFGDVPPDPAFPLDAAAKKLVMHTFLEIAGSTVMFSDVPPGMAFSKGNNISLVVTTKDAAEVRRVWGRLTEGGTVGMELGETFWSKLYGFVTDKYGIGWQLSLEA
jgi:PhnB protein